MILCCPVRVAAVPSTLNLYIKSQSTVIQLLLPLLVFYLVNHALISL